MSEDRNNVNELESKSWEREGPADAFDKGASGNSVGAGGFVEYLIFGCVQATISATLDN